MTDQKQDKTASALGDKIRQTQNSFAARPPGAVAPCPFASLSIDDAVESSPVEVRETTGENVASGNSVSPSVPPSAQKKKDWIEIILVDEAGMPLPGVRYRITPPDGAPVEGRLNEHGQAGLYQIDAGECKITFPDLDRDAWD